jgi:hypothetical protein
MHIYIYIYIHTYIYTYIHSHTDTFNTLCSHCCVLPCFDSITNANTFPFISWNNFASSTLRHFICNHHYSPPAQWRLSEPTQTTYIKKMAIGGSSIHVIVQTAGHLSERQGGYKFERCWNKWDKLWTVSDSHPLVGNLWRVPGTAVQAVWADSCLTIQVLNRTLTLLTRMRTSAAGYITLLQFVVRQER